jgi:hypothetical protein
MSNSFTTTRKGAHLRSFVAYPGGIPWQASSLPTLSCRLHRDRSSQCLGRPRRGRFHALQRAEQLLESVDRRRGLAG